MKEHWCNDINIFLSLENPSAFLLVKEKTWKCIFNTNSELSQNCTKKQIMPSKTTINWQFNGVWCYLFIACFDWKLGVFQQTVVRVYYIFKFLSLAEVLGCSKSNRPWQDLVFSVSPYDWQFPTMLSFCCSLYGSLSLGFCVSPICCSQQL